METKKLIEKMRMTANRYEMPPYGREIEGTVELLREAADKLEIGGASNVKQLLDGLAAGECKGIKSGFAYRIAEYAQQKGLVE